MTAKIVQSQLVKYASQQQRDAAETRSVDEDARYIYIPDEKGVDFYKMRVPEQFAGIAVAMNAGIRESMGQSNYSPREIAYAASQIIPQQLNPIYPVKAFFTMIPPAVRTIVELSQDQKLYPYKGPISRKNLTEKEKSDLSYVGKQLGERYGIDPQKFDFLITGVLGRSAGYLTGKPTAYNISRTIKTVDNYSIGRFYDKYLSIQDDARSAQAMIENGLYDPPEDEKKRIAKQLAMAGNIEQMLKNASKLKMSEDKALAVKARSQILAHIKDLIKLE